MTESKFYANAIDISDISEPILKLAMSVWFDKNDVISGKHRIDDVYVRIIGKDIEQIKARAEILKSNQKARHGGGVRIKEIKR